MNTQTKTKKTQNKYATQNPLEIVKGLGSEIAGSLIDDLGRGGINDAWDELLGAKSSEKITDRSSGDLTEGQEISFGKKQKSEQREAHSAPAIDYTREIVDSSISVTRESQQVIQSQIQEILMELKSISQTSSEIAMEFKEVAVEQRIESPGEYHVNFFQWMLSVVKAARTRIEDSGAWLNTMKSKKGQKNYWAMFKKHGTTFGLSNERVVATQTG